MRVFCILWVCFAGLLFTGTEAGATGVLASATDVQASAAGVHASETIPVRIASRVELLAIVFRLAGAPEYNEPHSKSPYADEVAQHFAPFKDHPAVKLAAKLREEYGISFDAVMSYAVHLKNDKLEPKIPFPSHPTALDKRWKQETAAKFLEALRQFVSDSKSDGFFAAHQSYYEKAAARLRAEVAKRPYRSWFDSFFGARPNATFCAIIGMLNGGGSYGVAVRYPGGKEEILPIIGASKFDAEGLPVFGSGIATNIVHEFCHSYTNPLADQFAGQLLPSANKIYPYRKALMKPQAYGDPRAMLYESLVRACTVCFALDNETPQNAARQLMAEQARGFLWTGDLAELLGTYEKERKQYPTFQAFMPKVVAFFAHTADSIEALMAKLPRIVSMFPANGDTYVNPMITGFRIEFDRPMQTDRYSIVGDPAQMPATPTTPNGSAKPRFSPDGKVFLLPIKLEAGKTYTFGINSLYLPGFRSAEGQFLDPVQVTFTTRSR